MSMSDDLTSTAIQLGSQVGETGLHAVEETFAIIEKLLQSFHRNYEAGKRVKSTDLTDIKAGQVSTKELQKYAKNNGISLTVSENAFTKDDINILKEKAKAFGIPLAFVNEKGKDNVYVQLRTADVPIFKNMCTEMMKDKLDTMPQELGNFKVNQWEIPYITNELNKHDLAAQFCATKDGQYMCVYAGSDEKAIMIARDEFVRKCDEVNNELSFDRDEDGNYTIKELHSGKEISFDDSMSQSELCDNIKKQFGYEDNKANIACAKFGEEMLSGETKERYFDKSVVNEFSKIERNITLEGESTLAKSYDCFRLTPKTDDIPRLVYQNRNGDIAVLNPEKMTHAEMTRILRDQLHIDDPNTVNALIDKADKVTDYYTTQNAENLKSQHLFTKSDFDMTDPDVVDNMSRTNTNGDILTKKLPIDSIDNQIERNNKDNFTVTCTAKYSETDKDGNVYTSNSKQTLVLSFSNKKKAAEELTDLYRKQGVPDHIAKDMAKDVLKKASAQSAEKVVQIEEIKTESVTVVCNGSFVDVDTSDRSSAIEEISKAFDVSDDEASNILDKVEEKKQEKMSETVETKTESEKIVNKAEIEKPESIKPEKVDIGNDNSAPEISRPKGRRR